MRHLRFFTLASGDRIVRPRDAIEWASNEHTTKEVNAATRAAEALSTTASLRGYFDDLLSAPRPKRTVKMERVVNSIKNCQMVLTRIGETTPSFSEIRSRRALPSIGDLIVFLVAGALVGVRVEQILAPPEGDGTFVVSLKEVVVEGRSLRRDAAVDSIAIAANAANRFDRHGASDGAEISCSSLAHTCRTIRRSN